MKIAVLKLDLQDEKVKRKAMAKVSGLFGVDSVEINMKDKKMTVKGEIDPVTVVAKLRKLCHADIVSVGPDKEPEKKKEEPKPNKMTYYPYIYQHPHAYQYQPPPYIQQHPIYYSHRSAEEDPNSCVIC